jgi:hypothetical protein
MVEIVCIAEFFIRVESEVSICLYFLQACKCWYFYTYQGLLRILSKAPQW